MKEYKIICHESASAVEAEVNQYAAEGYTVEKLETSSTGNTHRITVLMIRDQEVQEQKQKAKDFLDSYQNILEKAVNDELTDEDLDELNDETFEFLKGMGRVR